MTINYKIFQLPHSSQQVLKDSGVFEYTWAELELWLNQLARVEPSQQDAVIHFLERVNA